MHVNVLAVLGIAAVAAAVGGGLGWWWSLGVVGVALLAAAYVAHLAGQQPAADEPAPRPPPAPAAAPVNSEVPA